MKELKLKLKEEKDLLDFFNLHLKGMKYINIITFIYFLTPNSNELFLFCSLLYTGYYKILQIIYKKKITKTTNLIKQTALINLSYMPKVTAIIAPDTPGITLAIPIINPLKILKISISFSPTFFRHLSYYL